MLSMLVIFLLVVGLDQRYHGTSAQDSYDGYRVYRITIADKEQHEIISSMLESLGGSVDVWRTARSLGDDMDVMVAPSNIDLVVRTLEDSEIQYEEMIENVETLLEADRQKHELREFRERVLRGAFSGTMPPTPEVHYDFTKYHPLDEIDDYLDALATDFSDKVTLFTVGTSYEGRSIRGAKISTGGSGKPAVWVDSCIHAREWLACATTQFFIKKLLDSYDSDPVIADLLDNIDIYYVPVLNPDGYAYSWIPGPGHRLWRKTRSLNPGYPACPGTDANRNWGIDWCVAGASHNPCISDHTYCGSAPFSEPETSSTAVFLLTIPNLQLYMTYHTYGKKFLLPWGYTYTLPSNYAQQLAVCNDAINALKAVNGETFECVSSGIWMTDMGFGLLSGTARDWAFMNIASLRYAITPELRPSFPYGSGGFAPSASEIIPSGEENYAAFVSLLTTIRNENP